jgi:hypothetical protein
VVEKILRNLGFLGQALFILDHHTLFNSVGAVQIENALAPIKRKTFKRRWSHSSAPK